METINRIELQGTCSKRHSLIGFAGQPIGYRFDIEVDSELSDEEGRHRYFIPCQVMLLSGTPTANFAYTGGRPVHLIGRLTVRGGSALVEVTEIEYITEED